MSVLNITGGGGSYLNFHSTTDQWHYNKMPIQITNMVVNHHRVRTCWGLVVEGSAPTYIWDLQLGNAGPKPSPEYRRGFSARVYVEGYGWLDWTTISSGSAIGFDNVFEKIWNEKDQHIGQFAMLKYLGSKPIRIGKGNSRQPLFQVTGWIATNSLTDDSGLNADMPLDASALAAKAVQPLGTSAIKLPFAT